MRRSYFLAFCCCMIRASVFALVVVAVYATCDTQGFNQCENSMQSCQQSATNAADACLCMGHYDMCLQGLGCSPTIVNAAVQQCQTQGCTVAQCTTPGEELLRGCDPQPTRECAEQLFECATRGKGPLAQCPCRGPYLNCMKAAGCKSNVIQQLVQACEEIGCTPAQCHGRNNTDIATP